MNELFKTVLSLSISGTILAAPLFLFCLALKNRVSKAWQYYIWTIVIARMLLPITTPESLVGTLFRTAPEPVVFSSDAIWTPEGPVSFPTVDAPLSDVIERESLPVADLQERSAAISRTENWGGSFAFLIWILVAILLFTRKTALYQQYLRFVKAGRREISNPNLLDQFSELCESEHIHRRIGLYTNSMTTSPMLIGILRPFIVLPGTHYSREEFQDIIRHELIHYKRRDLLYKWLVQCTVCLHWFNPVVYLVSRMINMNCELSCDEALLKRLDLEGRKQYGNTLLATVRIGGKGQSPNFSVTLNEDGKLLKERLEAIMKFCKKSRWATALMALLTAAACMGAAVTGAYAAAEESSGSTDPTTPAGTVAAALDALKSQDMVEFDRLADNYLLKEELGRGSWNKWSYLCNRFGKSAKEGYSYFSGEKAPTGETKREADEITAKLSYQTGKTTDSGNSALVEVTITNRDFSDVLGIIVASSLKEAFNGVDILPNIPEGQETADDFLTLLKNTDSNSKITFQVNVPVKKINGTWKLIIQDDFTNAVFGNLLDGADAYLDELEPVIDEWTDQWAKEWSDTYLDEMDPYIDEWSNQWAKEWSDTYSKNINHWTADMMEDIFLFSMKNAFEWSNHFPFN